MLALQPEPLLRGGLARIETEGELWGRPSLAAVFCPPGTRWSGRGLSGSRWNWHRLATAVSSIAITRPTLVDTPAHDLSRKREGQPQRDGKCDRDDQQQVI